MQLGVLLRNMGPGSDRDTVLAAARAADATPAISDLWVTDHIAIPPDDAEGSGGRYLDPLATLGVLAGATSRIGLGTSVLVLPYRPALSTAKWVATIQELSGGRLRLGVGVGWMMAEFRAVGVDHGRRGRITDDTLAFLDRCFAADVVEANGQLFPRARTPSPVHGRRPAAGLSPGRGPPRRLDADGTPAGFAAGARGRAPRGRRGCRLAATADRRPGQPTAPGAVRRTRRAGRVRGRRGNARDPLGTLRRRRRVPAHA
jgi:alkanesulfonate monooxygenase SsuD/methylene tetrahydromethanopterin reductase-like flavin-dependent oxidoreductase (luciferase family)